MKLFQNEKPTTEVIRRRLFSFIHDHNYHGHHNHRDHDRQ